MIIIIHDECVGQLLLFCNLSWHVRSIPDAIYKLNDLLKGTLMVARDIKSTNVQLHTVFVLPLQANVEKTAFILSYLISKGRVPLLGLNDVISTILQVGNIKRTSWLLLQGLHQSRFVSSPNTGRLIIQYNNI